MQNKLDITEAFQLLFNDYFCFVEQNLKTIYLAMA